MLAVKSVSPDGIPSLGARFLKYGTRQCVEPWLMAMSVAVSLPGMSALEPWEKREAVTATSCCPAHERAVPGSYMGIAGESPAQGEWQLL